MGKRREKLPRYWEGQKNLQKGDRERAGKGEDQRSIYGLWQEKKEIVNISSVFNEIDLYFNVEFYASIY